MTASCRTKFPFDGIIDLQEFLGFNSNIEKLSIFLNLYWQSVKLFYEGNTELNRLPYEHFVTNWLSANVNQNQLFDIWITGTYLENASISTIQIKFYFASYCDFSDTNRWLLKVLDVMFVAINCLTCDRIQNRIWTWTLLSWKAKYLFYPMVDFP